jgi:hypothetical protein
LAGRYAVVIRVGSQVDREKFGDLDTALSMIEQRGHELERTTHSAPETTLLGRHFDPVQQVAARLELRGPRMLHAGVDVRGDGSAEAFTGWVRRQVVVQRDGESAYDALRRTLRG